MAILAAVIAVEGLAVGFILLRSHGTRASTRALNRMNVKEGRTQGGRSGRKRRRGVGGWRRKGERGRRGGISCLDEINDSVELKGVSLKMCTPLILHLLVWRQKAMDQSPDLLLLRNGNGEGSKTSNHPLHSPNILVRRLCGVHLDSSKFTLKAEDVAIPNFPVTLANMLKSLINTVQMTLELLQRLTLILRKVHFQEMEALEAVLPCELPHLNSTCMSPQSTPKPCRS